MADNISWGGGGNHGVNLSDNFGDQNGFAEQSAYGGQDGFGENGGHGADGACHNCGQDGHLARDCTEPRQFSGECFNCGEAGHSKAECTKPAVFRGTCNICDKEGHRATDCLDKPPSYCRNCGGEGHEAFGCKRINRSHIPDKLPEDAWADLKRASDERDLDEFKDAVQVLSKAIPLLTYRDIETKARELGYSVYLIAMEKEIEPTQTIVDLQGKIGCKYAISYFMSSKPARPHLKLRWPKDPEDNLKRLESVGIPMDSGVIQCRTCGELGHTSKVCEQEKPLVERVQVQCFLCDEVGHRVRDCKQERPQKKARECKICESTEHLARECPDKPAARTCRNCGSEDHMAKDCDKPRPCRNCDATGHQSRDCPEPKDWSRVTCNNCGEKGHTVKRCQQPIKEENNPDQGFSGFGELSINDNANKPDPATGGNAAAETYVEAPATGGGGW